MKFIPSLLKIVTLLVTIFSLVLIVNFSILTFDMMYPEQPTIYLANQTIHSVWDLLNIYLHPQQLQANIPFFRPSGHFLIYQIITPIIGWHNTKAFILVSLLFLTLIGYFLIRLYPLLFPSYQIGGWIAFTAYMMHPALSISKLTIMHFEYAYVFFVVASLYLFVQFTQAYKMTGQSHRLKFISAILLYAVAVTFKEPAIMLGPVMACYYITFMLNNSYQLTAVKAFLLSSHHRRVIGWLMVSSILLTSYILASWPSLHYGLNGINVNHSIGTVNAFLVDGLGLTHNYITSGSLPFPNLAWRTIVFPTAARLLLWVLLWSAVFAIIRLFMQAKLKSGESSSSGSYFPASNDVLWYQQSVIFLIISAALFMVLPLSWAMGAPWHYSLTLLCLCLIIGFSVEYLSRSFIKEDMIHVVLCAGLPILITIVAMSVNVENIDKYEKMPTGRLALAFNRNAIANPPANLKNQLNKDSVLVVEDSVVQNDYLMGNAAYPFLISLNTGDYDVLSRKQQAFYLKFDPTYSGTLFRYAYSLPSLKEEIYPFKIEEMSGVPNEIIYNWLLHANNIFSVGYDVNGYWADKTNLFKANLARVQGQRHLKIYNYVTVKASLLENKMTYSTTLSYPDNQLCRYTCDQDTQCKAYYLEKMTCYFFYKITLTSGIVCDHCVALDVKKNSYLN